VSWLDYLPSTGVETGVWITRGRAALGG
jgi:hypothetical protein